MEAPFIPFKRNFTALFQVLCHEPGLVFLYSLHHVKHAISLNDYWKKHTDDCCVTGCVYGLGNLQINYPSWDQSSYLNLTLS